MNKLIENFRVVPLDAVKREAKRILSPRQLKAAIKLVKLLKYYPHDVGLSIDRFSEGFELRIENPVIDKQGWLRAVFWVHEKSHAIYVIDVFWKKTNRLTTADQARMKHRIRQLRLALRDP